MHIEYIQRPSLLIRGIPCIKVFIDENLVGRKIVCLRRNFMFLDTDNLMTTIRDRMHGATGLVLDIRSLSNKQDVTFILNALGKSFWEPGKYKTNAKERLKRYDKTLYVWGSSQYQKHAQRTLNAIHCANIARDLASEPANIMGGPAGFVNRVKGLFKKSRNVKIQELSADDLQNINANLILAMGKGAEKEPKLLIIDYAPPSYTKTVCIGGKGVCYDSGGYDIKPKMLGMNTDKTGAAIAVACVYHAATHTPKTKTRIIALCPLIENRVSHNAILPGDVIKAYNGKTVEVLDTDAEGRVIMADVLSYICDKYTPDFVIDVGTYTGSASRMHCASSFVYYTQVPRLARHLEHLSYSTYERSIALPVWPEYSEYTKGNVADIKNVSDYCIGDASMAAMFLYNFIEARYRNKWLHIDVTHNEPAKLPTISKCNSIATILALCTKIK